MSGVYNCLMQQWQLPSSKFLLRSPKGPGAHINSSKFFRKRIQTTTSDIVKASYVPTAQPHQDSKPKEVPSRKLETLGAFQKLPMVMPSLDILHSALRKARRVSPTKGITNIAKRERNKGTKQLDALMKELATPLRGYMDTFPKRHYLHPYERALVELTIGDGSYEEVLKNVDMLRKKVIAVGKEHASHCAKSSSKREAKERLSEGVGKLEEIFGREGKAVDELLNIAKILRAMPVVDLEMPTLCLVGAPNVGKSSLVRILSTGKPEICNYPFTTRGILMGHISCGYRHFQVTDTPGLLRRHDGQSDIPADFMSCNVTWMLTFTVCWQKNAEDRNNLEKLTLAVLSHLPTAILFVHDLTGECGTSPSDQYMIYRDIKQRFYDHLWVDVISKSDLMQNSPVTFIAEEDETDDYEMAQYRKIGPMGALRVSVKSLEGLDELKKRVHELLIAQMDRIRISQEMSLHDTTQDVLM